MAAVFYPGRARCLEQSLALYVLLRRRGVPVRLRLGVQPYPFNAHAWVELNGAPLNERVETVRQFVPFEDFAV
jgi:transglutaminase-like putative cysteine protease